jgi:UPF0176 protein
MARQALRVCTQCSPSIAVDQAVPPSVVNIAGYRFVAIDDPQALRMQLLGTAKACGLRGTVLLAPEGINFCLAGPRAGIDGFIAALDADPRFAGIRLRRSVSAEVPFRKLLVKCKREIIRMDRPAIRPVAGRAPALDAATLRRWLDAGPDDAGRPVVLLDTRNAFEVDHGSFEGALDWRLARFGEFPQALAAHRSELEGRTVVSFCTGGIRCEKAALLTQEAGLPHVWQLDGGILQYFEEQGNAHFRGACFVFDEREALDADLRPRPAA